MDYLEFRSIAFFINNHGILDTMQLVAEEFNYDEYYTGTLTEQYYQNPTGFMSSHDCGRFLFEKIKEQALEIYPINVEQELKNQITEILKEFIGDLNTKENRDKMELMLNEILKEQDE